ncbi:TVP38/TMEM64 family protein [Candidatus Dependentiae bacterium]
MKIINKIRIGLLLVFIAIIFLFYYFGFSKYFTIASIKENRILLQQAIEKNYLEAVAGFMGIYIGLTALALPFAVLLTVVGGFLFGTFWGALYSCVAATIGSSIAFLLFRHLVGHWIHFKFGDKLKKFRKEFKRHGYSYLLSIHFSAIVPLFIVNIFASFAHVSFWTFVWTTAVGTFPAFLVYAFAGKQFTTIDTMYDIFSWKILIAFVFLAILASMPMIIRKYLKKKDSLDYVEI